MESDVTALPSYPGALKPPANQLADVNNPVDVLRTCNYVTQALTVLFVSIFVGTRFYAKRKILRGSLTLDDYATYSAYVLMIGYCITACFMSKHGGGLNQWDVSVDNITPFFQAGYAATLFYAPMAMTVKLALLIIIIRVFGAVHRKTLMGVYIFIGMLGVYYLSGFFIKMFICWPISAYWSGEKARCMNQSAIITADAIISVISDLVILLLPTPLTWSLQLPRRKRLRVTGLLCAGGIATGFSIYRLVLILVDRSSENQTIVFTKVVLSGNAEAGIGLICACLPAMNALFVRRGRGSSYYNKASQGTAEATRAGGAGNGGEIMLTRSFQVDCVVDGKKSADVELESGPTHSDDADAGPAGHPPGSQPASWRSEETL